MVGSFPGRFGASSQNRCNSSRSFGSDSRVTCGLVAIACHLLSDFCFQLRWYVAKSLLAGNVNRRPDSFYIFGEPTITIWPIPTKCLFLLAQFCDPRCGMRGPSIIVPDIRTTTIHQIHNADNRTHRKVMVIALLFCAAFVASAFLPKSSLTITTSSSKRTNWFVPRARRYLLDEFFGALGANGTR